MYNYNARLYDPVIGVFITADTIVQGGGFDPQMLNRYAYCRNNPLMYIDPSGHAPVMGDDQSELDDNYQGPNNPDYYKDVPNWEYNKAEEKYDFPKDIPYVNQQQMLNKWRYKWANGSNVSAGQAGLVILGGVVVGVGVGVLAEGAVFLVEGVTIYGATSYASAAEALRRLLSSPASRRYGIKSYNQLRKALQGTGLQAHHLIEKRFAEIFGVKPGEMMSIAVNKLQHQAFTNAWRSAIPYGKGTKMATKEQILNTAQQIYKDLPEILNALGF